jgi:hypothetical protein
MEKEIAFVLALMQQSKMVKYDINEDRFSDANKLYLISIDNNNNCKSPCITNCSREVNAILY